MKKILFLSLIMSLGLFAKDPELIIIYTNDMEGNITPGCCSSDPGGGIERRINWYNKNKGETENTIYINSGSTLFPNMPFVEYEIEHLKYGAELIAESMLAMNITAYTPSEADLLMGEELFSELTKKLPILLSNSNEKNIKKEITVTKAGKNIKIYGISTKLSNFNTMEPVKALKSIIKKKEKNDYIILLADTDKKTLEKILKTFKGIDLVLQSSTGEQLTKPRLINKTKVLSILQGGDSIGILLKENRIDFLGSAYDGKNDFKKKVKKFEGLRNAASPQL